MIDHTKLNFGDAVFYIDIKTNIFRHKTTMTDTDGNLWYRYIEPRKEYSIVEYKYCGKVETLVFGEVDDERTNNLMYFKNTASGKLTSLEVFPQNEFDEYQDLWHSTLQDAEDARIMMVLADED